MTTFVVVGAGMMGTALCWPLSDNHHTVRLVGTPLDEDIITRIRAAGIHPKLRRAVPQDIQPFRHTELHEAIQGADVVVSGVSSFGVNWFADTVGPSLQPGLPVIAVTKGLEDQPDGNLRTLPDVIRDRLPAELRGTLSLNAIGGPCIAHELAARRDTCVVFCGQDAQVLNRLQRLFATPYYHIWTSTDLVGVEVCAALKNGYALAVALAIGLFDLAGPDGLANMYNPQAALFAQGCQEMRSLLEILGGGVENAVWLPGAGDLYVTVFGGRTARMGRLLGQGLSFAEAHERLSGETLESVEIITRVARAITRLEARGVTSRERFPLLMHVDGVINHGKPASLPWERFFPGEGNQVSE